MLNKLIKNVVRVSVQTSDSVRKNGPALITKATSKAQEFKREVKFAYYEGIKDARSSK